MDNSKVNLMIITGGSKGLGKALVDLYLNEKWSIIEFSRSGKYEFSNNIDFAAPITVDKKTENCFIELAKNKWDEIILINNACTLNPIGSIAKYSQEDWISSINTNLVSGITVIGSFIKYFQANKSRKIIANISSGAAQKAYHGWSLYCAAKAGMEHFVRALAIEQKSEAYPIVTVNIDPYIMDTDMQAKIRNSDDTDFPDLSRFIRYKETGQLRSPESVAGLVNKILSGEIESGGRYKVQDV